jgi:hypothetical protein
MSVLVMHDDSHANEDLLVRMRSAKSVQEEPCRPPLVSAASGGKRWHARKELTKSRSIYLGRFASRDAATKASTAAAGVAARPSTAEPARKAAWAATEDPEADELPAGLSMIPTLPSVQLLPRPQSARGVRELAFGRSFPASTEPFPAPAPHGHCQLWTVSEKPRLLLLREEPVEGDARSWFPPELLPATVARFTRVSLLEDGQVLCVAHKASGDAESAVLVASLPGSPARGSRSSRATTTEATSCVVESERSRPWSSRTAASESSRDDVVQWDACGGPAVADQPSRATGGARRLEKKAARNPAQERPRGGNPSQGHSNLCALAVHGGHGRSQGLCGNCAREKKRRTADRCFSPPNRLTVRLGVVSGLATVCFALSRRRWKLGCAQCAGAALVASRGDDQGAGEQGF